MASIFKRNNGIWYIAYYDGHRRRWLSTGSSSVEYAVKFYSQNKDILDHKKVTTLSDLANEIFSYAKLNFSPGNVYLYKKSFLHFQESIGNKHLKLIKVHDIEKFKRDRIKNVSPTTVNIEFRMLNAGFNKAVVLGYLNKNPFLLSTQFKIPIQEPEYLAKEDFNKLLEIIPDRNFKELLVFAVSTMMRLGEITNLSFNDLDFKNRIIHIRNKNSFTLKSSRPRVIPMSEMVYHLLLSNHRGGNFIFTGNNGNKLNARSVSRTFKKFCRKAGLSERIHFHSLRHTGASWLIQENVPLYDVQKILGHSSPSVTQIYSHLSDENLRRSIEKISFT